MVLVSEKVLLLVILSLFVGEICQNVYFDGSHLQTSDRQIGPPIVSATVIHISELGSLVPKTPEKWSCLLFYDYLLARNVKMCFLTAAILNRPKWRPH